MLSDLSTKQLKELKEIVKEYKPKYREIIDVPGEIKFGCEVEFNTKEKYKFYKNYIDPKYKVICDASGMDIVEVISPIMHNCKEDWESLRNTLIDIKGASDAKISANSGGHIHFDHTIVDDDNILSLLKLWNVIESTIYDFSKGEFEKLRDSSKIYAQKLNGLENKISSIESGKLPLKSLKKYGKKHGLNLNNHFSYLSFLKNSIDTYEVRVPNGSLNINIWQNNVEFFSNLFYYANNIDNKKIISDLYESKKYFEKYKKRLMVADMLYSNEAAKIRFLNQFEQKEGLKKALL